MTIGDCLIVEDCLRSLGLAGLTRPEFNCDQVLCQLCFELLDSLFSVAKVVTTFKEKFQD